MRFRSSETKKREFLESHARQSEREFVGGCGLPSEFACSVLKVRAAVANLAGVDAEVIRAEDTFQGDLAHFDFWGSLDSIAVILELEACLGFKIPDDTASQIPDPEATPGVTVAEFVRNVLRAIQEELK